MAASIIAAAAATAEAARRSSAVAAARNALATSPPAPAHPAPVLNASRVLAEEEQAELEAEADQLADRALAGVPDGAKAAKFAAVRAGILKRLTVKASTALLPSASVPAPGKPTAIPLVPPEPHAEPFEEADVELQRPMALQRPPTELPPPQDGVEACGDEPWFADPQVRLALRDAVHVAHSELKILVRNPAEEIERICPSDGRVVLSGAVLRLGGQHLGGYGEGDIAYAYRQLSRALHPDKNRDNPRASEAFLRLAAAQDELRQGLGEARATLRRLSAPLRGVGLEEGELARPQEALFAEASRLLSAVLLIATEGAVPAAAQQRAVRCLGEAGGNWASPLAGAEAFLEAWLRDVSLLEGCASPAVRTAYDCAPKRYRAHFLCTLARLAFMEGARCDGCVRQTWAQIWQAFPEISLWQQLRELLQKKCIPHGRSAHARERSRSPHSSAAAEKEQWSEWARRWRRMIRATLPGGTTAAAPWSDPEVRKLCAALWRDFVDPIARGGGSSDEEGPLRALGLFRTEARGAADVSAQAGAAPAEWAFVPAADLLLVVGRGLVGTTIEGVFADAPAGTARLTYAAAIFKTMM